MRDAPPPPASPTTRLAALLERLDVRLGLSALIVLSLVPAGQRAALDTLFAAVFGAELALRVTVFARSWRDPAEAGATPIAQTRRRLGTLAFLLIDLFALLSFLPGVFGLDEGRWLRLARLTRMLLLAGYWSPLVRDLGAVLTRRERARQVALLGFVVLLLAFAGAAVLDQLGEEGIDFNGDGVLSAGDHGFLPRLWWSFRQVQDAGNLLSTPTGAAALLTSLALTLAGLLIVSFLIGLGGEVVRDLIDLGRERPVGLRRHFVVVHPTPGLPLLLRELNAYHEKLFRRARFTVVGDEPERPQALRAAKLARVHYRAFDAQSGAFAERADVASAKRVVVLSHARAPHPDAHTASVVLAAREANPDCWIVAEVLEAQSAAAIRVAGGPRLTLAPTERSLALYVAHAIRHPERLPLLRDLLTSQEGHEIFTYFFDYTAEGQDGALPAPAPPSFDWLYREGLRAPLDARVLPIGLIRGREDRTAPGAPLDLRLGAPAAPGDLLPGGPVRAVIAMSRDFGRLERFAEHLRAVGLSRRLAPEERPSRPAPALAAPPRPRRLGRALLCGYRPATLELAAALAAAHPGLALELVMAHPESLAAATEALRERAARPADLAHATSDAPEGRFEPVAPATWGWRASPDAPLRGVLHLAVADWMSEATLRALPSSGDHVGAMDLVVLLGGHAPDLDWRTAMAVLKLADLVRTSPERFAPGFEVVAGVRDPELGRRLRDGYRRAVGPHTRGVRVFATEQLRALFTFQSVAVPGSDAIFAELLGPTGHGIARLETAAAARADDPTSWSFLELGLALRATGRTLLAVELSGGPAAAPVARADAPDASPDEGGLRPLAPPDLDPHRRFAARDLVAVWTLCPEGPVAG